MAQFASDSFTGTSGTTLSTYNSAWVKHTSYSTGEFVISDANRARKNTTAGAAYYHTGSPASTDYSVSATLFTKQSNGGSDGGTGVIGRVNTGANTFYLWRYEPSVAAWQLYKFVSGTATQLGSNVSQSLADETSYALKLEMVGTAIKGYKEGSGSPSVSVTDNSITAAGKAGIRTTTTVSSITDTTGLHIDNFSADDIGSSSQTLIPSLVTNSQTFHAPTITTGAVSLTPSLVTNTQTFHSATVSRGGVSLQPSLVTNTQTFFNSTVFVGSVTLSPSLLTSGQTFYAPTVNQGIVLRPSLHTNTQTFHAPTISTGAISLIPSLVNNTQTFFALTVANVGGSQSLTPDLFTNEQTFYSTTVNTLALTRADLDAIAAAVWADATAVAAHAKLDAIIARLTC